MRTQLAQSRPSSTTAESILNDARQWSVDLINICNVSDQGACFSIYHDADGSTYNQNTAIIYENYIRAGETVHIESYGFDGGIANTDGNGNLAVQTDTASALTFTLYGTIGGQRY